MLRPVKIPNDKNYSALKTNLTLWIVYSSSQFKLHLDKELEGCMNLNIEWIELSHFNQDIVQSKAVPDLIYIETGDGWAQKVAHVHAIGSGMENNQTALIVFGDEADTASLKMALRLGASDYLSRLVELNELYPLLKLTAEDKVANKKMGALTLFINSKGGSGATTLATNTALELASYTQSNVLLIDLNMEFSDAADYLNSHPKYTINDVIDSMSDLDELSLDGLIYKHGSGLNYLSFNQDTPGDNYQYAEKVSKLLPILRQYYAHIIIDMSQGIENRFQQIVSPATHVFLVMQQNITSVKHASSYARRLEFDYGLRNEQIELIVNRYEKKSSIALKDIETTIPGKPIHIVPNNFQLAMECANLGSPIVQAKKSSAIKSALAAISHTLEDPVEEKQSWIKKLFS